MTGEQMEETTQEKPARLRKPRKTTRELITAEVERQDTKVTRLYAQYMTAQAVAYKLEQETVAAREELDKTRAALAAL